MVELNIKVIHPSWQAIISSSVSALPKEYYSFLRENNCWLPGHAHIFNAFSLPLNKTKFILFGESPYPRKESANGFAFWDRSVDSLWSDSGLGKKVNRAVSLRNLIKMLLVARRDLSSSDLSQHAIANLDKKYYVQDINGLFNNFLKSGFLLLNACLALTALGKSRDAKAWKCFMQRFLEQLASARTDITLILFGRIAKEINRLPASQHFPKFQCEHPFNHSFIINSRILSFFRPFDLLSKH